MTSHSAPLRGLFCGAGHFARIQLEAWRAVPGARIVALFNRTLDRAKAVQAEFALEAAGDDFAMLLENTRPDFIDICTSVETHLPLARVAAARGLPILCQKPLAPHIEQSEELVAACEAHAVRLMANDNWRWQGWYRELKGLIDAGAIGAPHHARFVLRPGDGSGNEPYPLQPFFREMERFLVLEVGGHYFDTMSFLLGPIVSLHATLRRRNPRIRGEDAALITLEFANGVTAVFDADRTACTEKVRPPVNGHAFIEGEHGNLRLDEEGGIFIQRRGAREERHLYDLPPGYRGGSAIAAQRHFIECLRTASPFETDGRAYLSIERAVDACYRSARQRTVEILA